MSFDPEKAQLPSMSYDEEAQLPSTSYGPEKTQFPTQLAVDYEQKYCPPQQPAQYAETPYQQQQLQNSVYQSAGPMDLPAGVKPYEQLDCLEKTALWMAAFFIAPLAVWMRRGSGSKEFAPCLLLWMCCFCFAGFYAAHVIMKYP